MQMPQSDTHIPRCRLLPRASSSPSIPPVIQWVAGQRTSTGLRGCVTNASLPSRHSRDGLRATAAGVETSYLASAVKSQRGNPDPRLVPISHGSNLGQYVLTHPLREPGRDSPAPPTALGPGGKCRSAGTARTALRRCPVQRTRSAARFPPAVPRCNGRRPAAVP